jgi:hypothetical protein
MCHTWLTITICNCVQVFYQNSCIPSKFQHSCTPSFIWTIHHHWHTHRIYQQAQISPFVYHNWYRTTSHSSPEASKLPDFKSPKTRKRNDNYEISHDPFLHQFWSKYFPHLKTHSTHTLLDSSYCHASSQPHSPLDLLSWSISQAPLVIWNLHVQHTLTTHTHTHDCAQQTIYIDSSPNLVSSQSPLPNMPMQMYNMHISTSSSPSRPLPKAPFTFLVLSSIP